MKKTSEKIIDYITQKGQASGKELADFLSITDRAVRKQLKSLFESGKIEKIGRSPKVFYTLSSGSHKLVAEIGKYNLKFGNMDMYKFSAESNKIIKNNFLYISPKGERIEGIKGFIAWCKKRSFDAETKAIEYVNIYKKYNKLKKDGLITGQEKIANTFKDKTCLDNTFYADFYAWEIFGKTKLGQLLLYGKQSQNKEIISEVVEKIKPLVENLIKEHNIEAVGFIPPTVKREIQFMKVLKEKLNINLPKIKIEKIKTEIITPQKTLSKLPDRIENAEHSIFATDTRDFSNVLLIDDAIGSGATMNQVSCKIKKANIAKKVYGFAITGSAKGFDVISEV